MAFYDRLRAEVPPSLVELLQIPGLGPKTVRQLHAELGIETVDDLRRAAEEGRLRAVRGMSAKTEALVLEGIARLEERFDRMRLDRAEELLTGLIDGLAATPGVISMEPAGSFRRRKESIGDLDLLAETDQPAALIDAFTTFGMVDSVINKGGYKAAVRLMRGPQVDLMVMPPGEAGTYRIHFTGLEGAQRPAPRDGPRPGLEPVREGLPAHRRGRRAADRRRRPSCGRSPPRPRRTPSSACRSSSPSCARTPARSRRRSPAGCRR